MVKQKSKKSKSKNRLRKVGLWATIWWGVTFLYIALVVWQSRNLYVANHMSFPDHSFILNWKNAIFSEYKASTTEQVLLVTIIYVWIAGGLVWLYELNRNKMSYAKAFRDLFLTIRR